MYEASSVLAEATRGSTFNCRLLGAPPTYGDVATISWGAAGDPAIGICRAAEASRGLAHTALGGNNIISTNFKRPCMGTLG